MPDYPRRRAPAHYLPLTVPVFQILLALADQDLHGYAIIQDIRQRTESEVELTACTLYAAIKRLLDGRLIDEVTTRPHADEDDTRRRYYRITPLGLEVARLETARLERTLRLARRKKLAFRKV